MAIFDRQPINVLTELVVIIRKLDVLADLVFPDDLLLHVTDVLQYWPIFLVEDLERNIAVGNQTELYQLLYQTDTLLFEGDTAKLVVLDVLGLELRAWHASLMKYNNYYKT